MRFAFILLVVAACGSNDDHGVTLPDGPGRSPGVTFSPFTAKTETMADADGSEMQIAMSDGTGAIACGLSSDQHNSLGSAGHEIIMALQPPNGFPCPVGSYAVPSNCPTDDIGTWLGAVPEKCAYYREWDASGAASALLPATAGSVTVSGDENSCTVNVTFSFSGTQWTDTFTVTNLLAPEPWCS